MLGELRGPDDLRRLPRAELPALADEIRSALVGTVVDRGGHLGPNLGVVELTIALHRVFESPRDAIVWDTGHQSYVHKMLTGRAHLLDRLRGAEGLSGYPARAESPHDHVENSHASAALSYVDGLAKGFRLGDPTRRAVAVVGDGALTGGMCWEALNNIGVSGCPVVVVVNDNGRSYSPTVGAVAAHLRALREGTADSNLFATLGFGYVGPVDGHDAEALEDAFAAAREHSGPVVVHCLTVKGAGYRPAENDEADCMHTVRPRTRGTKKAADPAWTDVFGVELTELGAHNERLVAVTAAMLRPTGLFSFAQAFPDRVFDAGIAEQHAVTSAAGLAMAGLDPVVALYATFLNRAFDQLLMDVALHRLPVTFVLDRAGITGVDGPSHHGMWDVSMLGQIPGMRVAAPRDAVRLRSLLADAVAERRGPTAVRYPSGRTPEQIPTYGTLGSADLLTPPDPAREVLILPVGPLAHAALDAAALLRAEGIPTAVADPMWIVPVDPALTRAAARFRLVVTVEDNAVPGGFGDALARSLRTLGRTTPLLTLGLADGFVEARERSDVHRLHGLDAAGLCSSIAARYARTRREPDASAHVAWPGLRLPSPATGFPRR
ncbi:1-deoxy-D-xylulose-5-phosphate synthase [Rhodococcus sp. HNM0569]|uniref:1-deoxy-D-xylulose-5-phosphate synthase n=1 Tax=Rhodococcus sp. HNM0569 TaxID=2716340 RepID=UPI00197DA851